MVLQISFLLLTMFLESKLINIGSQTFVIADSDGVACGFSDNIDMLVLTYISLVFGVDHIKLSTVFAVNYKTVAVLQRQCD